MESKHVLVFIPIVAFACAKTHDEPRTVDPTPVLAYGAADYAAVEEEPADEPCNWYSPYIRPNCGDEKAPLGAFCVDASECESNLCVDGTCVDEASCLPEGADCRDATLACCEGTACEHNAYVSGWGTCVHRAAPGEACSAWDDCETYVCTGGLCRHADCREPGTAAEGESDCSTHEECCSGYCADLDTYGWPHCGIAHETGTPCRENIECSSGICEDFACVDVATAE